LTLSLKVKSKNLCDIFSSPDFFYSDALTTKGGSALTSAETFDRAWILIPMTVTKSTIPKGRIRLSSSIPASSVTAETERENNDINAWHF
jgi:hypothetical protein